MAADLPRFLAQGRYELLEPLGSGGTATVWRGRDHTLQVDRAVKVLKSAVRNRPDLQQRMMTEARVLASINHPGVVPIFDFGHDGEIDFMVTELVRGDTVHQRVRHQGVLEPAVAVRVMATVLDALHAAHERGVVHRDVKPSNILVDEDGLARLIDFGIARAPDAVRMTAAGVAMGTMAFMAPEQRQDAASVGPAADIYAAGATLYWMLTALSPMDLAWVDPDDKRWAQIPLSLKPIILQAMQNEPGDRFAAAPQMARALRAVLPELEPQAGDQWAPGFGNALARIRSAYVETLPGLIVELRNALATDPVDAAEARRVAHNLRGSGGSYGYPEISKAGAAAEDGSDEQLRSRTEQLIAVLQASIDAKGQPDEALVVHGDAAMRTMLARELETPRLKVRTLCDAAGALDFLSRHRPEVLVVGLTLPDADGRVLLRSARAIHKDLPVVVIGGQPESAAQCLELGALHYFNKPLVPGEVGRAVRVAIDHTLNEASGVHRVLAAEDDPFQQAVLQQLLRSVGIDVSVVGTGAEVLAFDGPTPSLFLLDAGLPDMDGFTLLNKLRAHPRFQAVPVVFVTARDATEDLVRGLSEGAEDYITKPVVPAELVARVQRVLRRA